MARINEFETHKADALALTAYIPIGSKLFQQRVNGRDYWYAQTPKRLGLSSKRRYIGNDQNRDRLLAAWREVSKRIAKLDAAPAVKALRELEPLRQEGFVGEYVGGKK